MPELPEVEVVKRSLEKKIKNKVIKNVKINDGKLRYKVNFKNISFLFGKKIKKIERRSKFLIFRVENKIFLLAHLGMTGKFLFIDKKNKKYKTSFYYDLKKGYQKKHDRLVFILKNGQKLIYNDVRKFGFIKVYNSQDFIDNFHLKNLGPEPLNKSFNLKYFRNYIFGRKRTVKNILMDQKFVSGLGNIYVNEVLFLSGVRPDRKVESLKNLEISKIIGNTKKILITAIRLGGSSIKDFSSDNGKKGFFQQHFKVYGRKGERCSNIDCNKNVIKTVISNRATFFCKKCQK